MNAVTKPSVSQFQGKELAMHTFFFRKFDIDKPRWKSFKAVAERIRENVRKVIEQLTFRINGKRVTKFVYA